MAKQTGQPSSELSEIVGGTIADVEKLIGQHFDLLRSELKDE